MNMSSMKIIDSLEKTEKRKRVSKKSKKAWRKHTKVEDIELFLEDQRLEERLGKKFQLIEENDSLFELDKTGKALSSDEEQTDTDDTGFEDDDDEVKPKNQISRNKWRQNLLNKPFKCYKILEPDTQVPDPIAKRNRVRTKEERQHPIAKLKEIERKEKGILKQKEKEAILTRKVNKARKEKQPIKGQFIKDIWVTETSFLDKLGKDKEWLDKETIQHTKKNTGLYKKKKDDKEYIPYIIEAIEPPHPGMSYHPTTKDHLDLLSKVTEDEMKLIKEEEHLTRVTTKMFKKISPQEQEKEWFVEMSQGLDTENDIDNENIGSDDGILKSVNPPALNKKKNLQKRRKLKEQLNRELKRKREIIEKKKIADLYKIKHMKKDIEKVDKKVALLQGKREKIKGYKSKEAKQLSKNKFKPLDLDFNMRDELKNSLRLIKQEGCLLKDRFNSLQKRNIIETRVRQRRIKPKIKKYIKKSHRDPEDAPTKKKSKKSKSNYFSKD